MSLSDAVPIKASHALDERLERIEKTLDELNSRLASAPDNLVQPKNRGGRPRTIDWDEFFIEAIWFEYAEEGFHSRHQLQQHMEAWSIAAWGDRAPNLKAIRQKVGKIADRLKLPP
jgi:hypothetical protein